MPSAFGSLLSTDAHNLVIGADIGADIRYLADAAYNLSNLLISDHLMLMSMLTTFLNRVSSTTLLLINTLVANDKLVLLVLIKLMWLWMVIHIHPLKMKTNKNYKHGIATCAQICTSGDSAYAT